MLTYDAEHHRTPKTETLRADLVVVGGGLAGTCCGLTAARAGATVVLIQDRPVLGGNASSEIRLWALGATSHMGNNNRWAREGGAIDEILVENIYRNPEGNPLIFDTILLEKVAAEPNITLLLNTAVFEATKHDAGTIASVRAFCSQNSTMYLAEAPLFCDASGDGVLGFLAGAAFRMGAEARAEFSEKLAPSKANCELLGHSLYFYTKDTGKPVRFTPPAFALAEIEQIPKYRRFNTREHGCELWWIEYGGRLDTVHDTERIKWELWRVVYGVWNYIKNSGEFPEAETLTLEWVGTIPGKRESRRFEGDHILTQQDIVEQRPHDDAVSFGGWAIDLHPADGVFSELPSCRQWHAKGVYPIPYRCLYSRNIANLLLAGRIISASHVAFASSRVMATCAHGAQAAGMAAALCREASLQPRDLTAPERMKELQRRLIRAGQYIPNVTPDDPGDLARQATIRASSSLELAELPPSDDWIRLDTSRAMLLPVAAGRVPALSFLVAADEPVPLEFQLRRCSRLESFTPDVTLAAKTIELPAAGAEWVTIDFDATTDADQYLFVCLMAQPQVRVHVSDRRVTGVLALEHGANKAVAESATQAPEGDLGIDTLEFWLPERRPGGRNLAMRIEPALKCFDARQVISGVDRPTTAPGAWVADPTDPRPTLSLHWDRPHAIRRIELVFDTDFDHPMESVLLGHSERAMPFCVRHFRILDAQGRVLHECRDNHQTRRPVELPEPAITDSLRVECLATWGGTPAALFRVSCEGDAGHL
ncbi:MAG: FAD-dependent oxidoreductase [Thermoguttaceae bacterium]|jgi:hypothetical protein|nr:FAD-dependent oxidoreductase [Thermoguttaceae bacterium]